MNAKQLKLTSLVAGALLTSSLSAHALTLGPISFTTGSNVSATLGGQLGATKVVLRSSSNATAQDKAPWAVLPSVTQKFSSFNLPLNSGWSINGIYVVSPGNDLVVSFWDAGLNQPFINFASAPGTTWAADGSIGGIILNDNHGGITTYLAQSATNPSLTGSPTFPYQLQANHNYSILITRKSDTTNSVVNGTLYIEYELAPIPEPSTYALALGGGVLGVSFFMRQRQKQLA